MYCEKNMREAVVNSYVTCLRFQWFWMRIEFSTETLMLSNTCYFSGSCGLLTGASVEMSSLLYN